MSPGITITLNPTPKEHLVYEALKTKDEVFFGGGAGGGKSWTVCESRLVNCYLYPGYRSFIGREELKRLMQSTYITWNKVCRFHKIPQTDWHFNGQYNYIEFSNGSRIDLLDLKYLPSDPFYERFGSLEYSDGAIEEAGEIDALAKDVLRSRVGRHMSDIVRPTLLITGNPKKNWTYRDYYKPWKNKTLPENKAFIQALYEDNPFTKEVYGKQLSGITDKVMRERLMFGNWEYEGDASAMVNYDAIQDLYTNTIPESKELYLVVDAARYGRDFIVFSFWKGLEWYAVYYKNKQSTEETEEDIRSFAAEHKIPYSHILVDEDGIGGGIVDHLRGIKGFVANRAASVSEVTGFKENYKNLKSQCAFLMAEKINNHLCKVSFSDVRARELLSSDLEQYRVKNVDSDQKKAVCDKEEMKEHLGRSPDFGDCFLMRMYFEVKRSSDTIPEYTQPSYEPMSPFEVAGDENKDPFSPFNA